MRNPDDWINAPDSFDLIISCLQLHHSNSEEELFKKYLTTLKPDGALLGSCFTEGTLKELYWAYLMAEN